MIHDEMIIKELVQSDAAWLFCLMNKSQVMEYIPDRFESIHEMEEVVAWLISNYTKKDYIRLTYKIIYKTVDVGWISIGPLPSDETRQEVAYVVDPEYWGNGIATSALRYVLTEIIPTKTIEKLYAEVDADNYKSIMVLEKNGFSRETEFPVDGDRVKYLYSKNTPTTASI